MRLKVGKSTGGNNLAKARLFLARVYLAPDFEVEAIRMSASPPDYHHAPLELHLLTVHPKEVDHYTFPVLQLHLECSRSGRKTPLFATIPPKGKQQAESYSVLNIRAATDILIAVCAVEFLRGYYYRDFQFPCIGLISTYLYLSCLNLNITYYRPRENLHSSLPFDCFHTELELKYIRTRQMLTLNSPFFRNRAKKMRYPLGGSTISRFRCPTFSCLPLLSSIKLLRYYIFPVWGALWRGNG